MGRETHEQGETITIYIKADSCPTPPLTLLGEDCCRLSVNSRVRKGRVFIRDEGCRGALQDRPLLFLKYNLLVPLRLIVFFLH